MSNISNNVICYYSHLDTEGHQGLQRLTDRSGELVDYWKTNWHDKGWNPIVLETSDAEKHDHFAKLLEQYHDPDSLLFHPLHNRKYMLECYSRWLAYAAFVQENGPTLWCDYDVYNKSFTYDKTKSLQLSSGMMAKSGSTGLMDSIFSSDLMDIHDLISSSTSYDTIPGLTVEQQSYVNENKDVFSDMIAINLLYVDNQRQIQMYCTDCWKTDTSPDKTFMDFDMYHMSGGVTDPSNVDDLAFTLPYDRNFTRLECVQYVCSILDNK